MHVDPLPVGISECLDLDGNGTVRVWFNDQHDTLIITTTFRVQTLHTDPFDFLLDPDALTLPVAYPGEIDDLLAPYRSRSASDNTVAGFAHALAKEVDGETVSFLNALTRRIHETCAYTVRPLGDPWPASITLAKRQGACRDLTILFLEACRALGLAARFVSGYHAGDTCSPEQQLHAWGEVYLPGAGWRGYDPTAGLAVADQHIAIATGPTPKSVEPTTGTFRGTDATSTLRASIRLQALDYP